MIFYNGFNNIKSESGTVLICGAGFINLIKSFKHKRQRFLRYTAPGIRYRKYRIFLFGGQRKAYCSAVVRKLNGIINQIVYSLMYKVLIRCYLYILRFLKSAYTDIFLFYTLLLAQNYIEQ